jgi:spermidine synthase
MAFLKQRERLHVGTIGLGVGTTATYARPGDRYRFYEINPEVVRQANEFFTFLKDCKSKPEIIMGDGRLALERELPQSFDLLVCDAFSGDSIPMHLATLEAFEIYKKHLKPDGILAVNITNSYIDIFPMLRAMADRIGYQWTRVYVPKDADKLYYRTDWLLLTNNQEFLEQTPSEVPADRRTDKVVPIWTDHFSNLWDVLR